MKLIICHFQEDQRWRLSYSRLPEQERGKNCSEYWWKWQSAWKKPPLSLQKTSWSCATRCPCSATCCRRTRWREPRWRTWGSTSGSSQKEVARPTSPLIIMIIIIILIGCPSYLFPDRVTDTSIVDTDAIAEVKRILNAPPHPHVQRRTYASKGGFYFFLVWRGLPKNHQMEYTKSAKITKTSQTFLPFEVRELRHEEWNDIHLEKDLFLQCIVWIKSEYCRGTQLMLI